jgi:hypothetical protein
VRGHGLGVFERSAGLEVGGDAGRAEDMATEFLLKAGIGRVPADHAVGIDPVHRLLGQHAGLAGRRAGRGGSCRPRGCRQQRDKGLQYVPPAVVDQIVDWSEEYGPIIADELSVLWLRAQPYLYQTYAAIINNPYYIAATTENTPSSVAAGLMCGAVQGALAPHGNLHIVIVISLLAMQIICQLLC